MKPTVEKRIHQLLGYCVLPATYLILLLRSGSFRDNYTGMCSDANLRIPFLITVGISLLFLLRLLQLGHTSAFHLNALAFFILCTPLIPYRGAGALTSNLHIGCALIAFATLNAALFPIYFTNGLLPTYICLLFTCMLLVVDQSQITGLMELLYASGVSILLTHSIHRAHK